MIHYTTPAPRRRKRPPCLFTCGISPETAPGSRRRVR